jgi:hypothetical protein
MTDMSDITIEPPDVPDPDLPQVEMEAPPMPEPEPMEMEAPPEFLSPNQETPDFVISEDSLNTERG